MLTEQHLAVIARSRRHSAWADTTFGLLAAHDALDIDGLQLEHDLVRREEISVIL